MLWSKLYIISLRKVGAEAERVERKEQEHFIAKSIRSPAATHMNLSDVPF